MRFLISFLFFLIISLSNYHGGDELRWNRYTTKNFEILSLDDAQGAYLKQNIENINKWITFRWGIKESEFKEKCKIICVPSGDLYERLFYRKNSTYGDNVVWLVTSENKWNTAIPVQLTEVILNNLEKNNGKFPFWFHRGMSVLNGRIDEDIKKYVQSDIDSKKILEMNLEDYKNLDETKKTLYDGQAATFCLWIRQEYGNKVFLDFLGIQDLNYLKLQDYQTCNFLVREYVKKLSSRASYSW